MVKDIIQREVLVRDEADTDLAFGVEPNKRAIKDLLDYGIIVVNKQQGPTSHQIVDYVKSILDISKAGHSGTLDPNVTGVLVVALAKATRTVEYLLKSGKEYVCLMRLHDDVDEKKIREAMSQFIGEIDQFPPKKSAVKRQWRKREIYYLEVLEVDGRDVLFKVGCQAGTYVRKICTDVGLKIGVKAHMQELVRTKVANFSDENWISLHDLKDAYVKWKEDGDESELRKVIKPMEAIVEHMPKVWVFDSAVDSLCHGAFLSVPGISKLSSGVERGNKIAVLSLKNELIGIGEAKMNSQNLLRQEKGIAVADLKVFMIRGTYPKYKRDEES
jgi:H/ACA ribonucleoprotein complex subunit 4